MAINLGNISFGIGPNLGQLVQATSQVFNFTGAMRGMATSIAAAGQAATAMQGRVTTAITALAAAQNAARVGVGGGTAGAGGQQIRQVTALTEALRTLSSVATLTAGPLSGLATRLSVLSVLAGRFTLEIAGMVAGIAAGAYAFYKMSTAAVETAKSLEKVKLTLGAVTGDQTIAATQMKYLMDLSNRSGTSFEVLAKQYGQFTAAAKGTSLEGERARDIFEAITFATSKLGGGTEELRGSLLALQQMISKGKISAEELRQQLGERLPGAMQIMASALGVTTQKLDTMMKKGELNISSLTKFQEALRKRYNIDTTKDVDTIAAAEQRLANARLVGLDVLDKTVGISQAYKNAVNGVTAAVKYATDNMADIVKWAGIAAATLAAMATPALIAALGGVALAIGRIALAVVGLNAAAVSVGGFAMILAKLSLGFLGYKIASEYMEKANIKIASSMTNTLPAVDEYIKAQQTLKSSVRATTEEYLTQQKALLATTESSLSKASADAGDLIRKIAEIRRNDAGNDQYVVDQDAAPYERRLAALRNMGVAALATKTRIQELEKILAAQTKAESTNRADPIKELTDRQNLAIKNAQDTIKETNAKYATLNLAPAAKEQAEAINEVNKAVENYRDVLTRAEVPAKTVVELTTKYGEALKALKLGEISLRNTVSTFQMAEQVFSRAADVGLTNWVDTIVDGKDKLEALNDTVKAVAKDILNTFMKLAVLNPIKNALFGTSNQTLGGGGGIGGLLGGFFSGGGGQSMVNPYSTMPIAGVSFASGGVMTDRGPMPLRKYASGGVANSPQLAMYGEGSGPEAYVPLPDGRSIPVKMQGSGNNGVEVHIHESAGASATVQSSKSQSGGTRLDIILKGIVQSTLMEDLAGAGAITQGMERRFGLSRVRGAGT